MTISNPISRIVETIVKNVCGPLFFQVDIPGFRRQRILETVHIDLVLDIGANTGQFAREIQRFGYTGKIISFEPLTSAYEQLSKRASKKSLWQTEHCAIDSTSGMRTIHIAKNSQSSSLLEMLPAHSAAAPESIYIGDESVRAMSLAQALDLSKQSNPKIFVKLDTQGSEMRILEGGKDRLSEISLLQVELSLIPLYQGAPTAAAFMHFLRQNGFELVSIEAGFENKKNGQLLQFDGIFAHQDLCPEFFTPLPLPIS